MSTGIHSKILIIEDDPGICTFLKTPLTASGYDISVGVVSGSAGNMDVRHMLAQAELEMYKQKQIYYQQPGRERRRR